VLALLVLAADRPAPKDKAPRSRQKALERFRNSSPEERLKQVEKLVGTARAFVAVTRADLVVTVVERGVLEPARTSDVYCAVRSGTKGSSTSTIIKWVIDEGAQVKKGDKLMELDSSAFEEQLKDKSREVDLAQADKMVAEENLEIQRLQNKIDLRLAELSLKEAKRALKKYTEDDEDEKESLKDKVEVAELSVRLAKMRARASEAVAKATSKVKESIYKQELARKQEIEAEIAKCTIKAPQNGLVIYYIPELVRGGGGSQHSVVAQGEPVREGQKMLCISDFKRFTVIARVHDALVGRVRVGQPVAVRVDAFPRRLLRGRVKSIAKVAAQLDWFASDVKVFPVKVDISEALAGLKPGMSAEVRIEVARREKVLQVPVESVLRNGRETFCYVKVGKELQVRPVTTGARNDLFVEIAKGLKVGERVLRAPRAVAAPPARTSRKGDGPAGPRVLVRSVRPEDESGGGGRRAWVQSFGLTYKDLERIRAVPDVSDAIAVRSFPAEANRREHRSEGMVIATEPGYAELPGIRLAVGRFLDEEDELGTRNVAVLGATAFERLFPEEEAIDEVVRLGGSAYRVVGVLREQDRPVGNLTADEVNTGVFIPLQTCRRRFGDRIIIRRGNTRRAEAVPLSEVLVATGAAGEASHVGACIAALLEESHRVKDWDVKVVPVRRSPSR
jgi:multidrug efflux pump subunit AcrA (membrane-fusion protein)